MGRPRAPASDVAQGLGRGLQPGAYCLAGAGTRTYDLITMALRFADFEIEDTWQWLYGQGMPKRVRLDLKIDEHYGMKDARPVLGRSTRQMQSAETVAKRAADGRLFAVQDPDAGRWTTGAAQPDADRFVGWDRASRPGWEPIIVAVKPLRGTIAETALRYGTGGMNADGCRIPRARDGEAPQMKAASGEGYGFGYAQAERPAWDARGGFPANVIIDGEVAAELDRLTGSCRARRRE